jgi:hypothetical protein
MVIKEETPKQTLNEQHCLNPPFSKGGLRRTDSGFPLAKGDLGGFEVFQANVP